MPAADTVRKLSVMLEDFLQAVAAQEKGQLEAGQHERGRFERMLTGQLEKLQGLYAGERDLVKVLDQELDDFEASRSAESEFFAVTMLYYLRSTGRPVPDRFKRLADIKARKAS